MLWHEGTTRLLDYGSSAAGPAVMVVPSLINRYYVLDLLPERSFLRHLAGSGLRPLVIDWGAPGAAERGLDLTGYIASVSTGRRRRGAKRRRSDGASRLLHGRAVRRGGGVAAPAALACLALLATPWDFHAGRGAAAQLLASPPTRWRRLRP